MPPSESEPWLELKTLFEIRSRLLSLSVSLISCVLWFVNKTSWTWKFPVCETRTVFDVWSVGLYPLKNWFQISFVEEWIHWTKNFQNGNENKFNISHTLPLIILHQNYFHYNKQTYSHHPINISLQKYLRLPTFIKFTIKFKYFNNISY